MISLESDRERTIHEYRYLCARGARKFMRDGIDRRDLEQVAAIGLIKAADRFDPSFGTPFEASTRGCWYSVNSYITCATASGQFVHLGGCEN